MRRSICVTEKGSDIYSPQLQCRPRVSLCLFPRGTEGCPSQSLREVTRAALQMRVKPEEPPKVLGEPGRSRSLTLSESRHRKSSSSAGPCMSSRSSLISKMHAESDLECLSFVPHSWGCRQNPEERRIVQTQLSRPVGRRASLLSLIS